MNAPIEQDAVARRLGKLAAMPVDTTRVSARIMAEIPKVEQQPSNFKLSRYWSRMAAIAASMILAITLLAVSFWPAEAVASPAEFARIHREMISGQGSVMVAQTIEQANAQIAGQWEAFPKFPDTNSPSWVPHACCLRNMKNAKVAFALVAIDGKMVSIAVARAEDIRSPQGRVEQIDGRKFHIANVDEFTMVMTERDGRWLCLTGEADAAKLINAAKGLGF